jgi:hypothetical protein
MTRAFVLGNGVSRRGLNLHLLKYHGRTYGCNALYREFTPDCLVSTDRPISTLIQETGYSAKHRHHTRKPIEGLGAQFLLPKYHGYSSGPNATALACNDGARIVYLVGFDMGPGPDEKFNNLYAGTEFYKPVGASPTYTGNWVRQLCTVMRDFDKVKFIRVRGTTTADVAEFARHSNFSDCDFDWFEDCINNQKELA